MVCFHHSGTQLHLPRLLGGYLGPTLIKALAAAGTTPPTSAVLERLVLSWSVLVSSAHFRPKFWISGKNAVSFMTGTE